MQKNKYKFSVGAATTKLTRGDHRVVNRCLRVLKDDKYDRKFGGGGLSYVSFFNIEKKSFPTGLLLYVTEFLKKHVDNVSITINDTVVKPELGSIDKDILPGITLYDYQVATANKALECQRGTIIAATGSGKTVIMMAILAELSFHKLKTLIIVPTTNILLNTAQNIRDKLDIDVGMYGDKFHDIKDVTVITNQSLDAYLRGSHYKSNLPIFEAKVSLARDDALGKYVASCDAIMVDEVHLSTAPAWYNACMLCNGWFRIGLTGTVDSTNEERMFRLRAATGDIITEITADSLINSGHLAKPYIHAVIDQEVYSGYNIPDFTVDLDGGAFYHKLYNLSTVENVQYNTKIVDLIEVLYTYGQAVLILTNRKKQLSLLSQLLSERDIEFFMLSGDTPLGVRAEAVEVVERDGHGVILATKIFDIGVDIPALNSVILTAGGRAEISTRQRIGRGLRAKPGENVVHIYDFMNVSHTLLAKHSLQRWEIYEAEKFTIIPEDNFEEMLDDIRGLTDG